MISLREIVNIVSMASGFEPNAIIRRCQTRAVTQARGMAIWLAYRHTGASSSMIGDHMGSRDHTTILAALKAFEEELKTDDALKAMAERLAKLVAWKSYAATDGERDVLKIARSIYLDPRRAGMGTSMIDIHALAATFLTAWDIAIAAEEAARLYVMRQALRSAESLTGDETEAAELLDRQIGALFSAIADETAAMSGEPNQQGPSTSSEQETNDANRNA